MAKCLSNGLNYPYYVVDAYVWEADKSKENCGDYTIVTLLETESYDEAYEAIQKAKLSTKRPEVRLFREDEDGDEWICTKDEYGIFDA